MRQIFQNLKTGEIFFEETLAPKPGAGRLLIATSRTLISKGTEKMLLDFGQANILGKIRQQPDKVRQVLNKISTDGLLPTLEAVQAKLDQPLPMGYCNAGVVIDVGEGVRGFRPGDRVLSNGPHAEQVSVPQSLCVKIPDGVSDDEAPFAVLGAIALQGVRLAAPTIGEHFVVMGLGLIGLLTVQILRANGCRVIGLDFDESKLKLARDFGAETISLAQVSDPVESVLQLTRGRGADGVLIAASTSSDLPMHQAALFSRKRGRVILLGVVGLKLSRADFFEKEITFQVSCSYGPGRYDSNFEERGLDYPIGFVRWTEQRNFEAVLELMEQKKLNVLPLLSRSYPFDEAPMAYSQMSDDTSLLGLCLTFDSKVAQTETVRSLQLQKAPAAKPVSQTTVAFIGAGNYASRVLMPAFVAHGARIKTLVSSGGAAGIQSARKNGVEIATTDLQVMLDDPEIQAVVIATRHDSHAELVARVIKAGKAVFVEKPLSLDASGLEKIRNTIADQQRNSGAHALLCVGFNRRYAPQVVKLKSLLSPLKSPKCIVITVNAGAIDAKHWTQDPKSGGGRVLGEACHFIDLARHLVGAPIVSTQGLQIQSEAGDHLIEDDKCSLNLAFADGSIATIHYFANGHSSFPKERIEVFCGGQIFQIDNFKKMRAFGVSGFKKMNLWNQDKGQKHFVDAFVQATKGRAAAPIPLEELFEVAERTIEVATLARSSR